MLDQLYIIVTSFCLSQLMNRCKKYVCVYLPISKVFTPLFRYQHQPQNSSASGALKTSWYVREVWRRLSATWSTLTHLIYTLSSSLITICCVGAGACSSWVMWVVSHIVICVLDLKCKSDSSADEELKSVLLSLISADKMKAKKAGFGNDREWLRDCKITKDPSGSAKHAAEILTPSHQGQIAQNWSVLCRITDCADWGSERQKCWKPAPSHLSRSTLNAKKPQQRLELLCKKCFVSCDGPVFINYK